MITSVKISLAAVISMVCSMTWLTQCSLFRNSHRVKSQSASTRQSSHSTSVISGDKTGILVEQDFIRRYKLLETKYGTVPEDAMIYMEGDKYRIPSAVADHFNAMVRGGQ